MATTTSTSTTTSSSNSGATLCTFYAKNKCSSGSACKFYHAPREDVATTATATTSTTNSSSKSVPCSFFAKGKCSSGNACKFYHAPREDLAKSPLPCKFYLKNACQAGRECKFSHVTPAATRTSASTGEESLAPGALRVPCKFFKYSECSVGDKCPYLHVKSSPHSNSSTKSPSAAAAARHAKQTKPPSSSQPAGSTASSELEEKRSVVAAATGSAVVDDDQHLSDFLTQEEEVFYYGAPGAFAEIDATLARAKEMEKSYIAATTKNVSASERDAIAASAIDPHNFAEAAARPKTCTFFLQGLCRYGDSCFYMHSLPEDVETEADMIEMGAELEASAALECNICYDNIVAKNERFGLLSGCNHAFCLPCVRNWRGTVDQPKQTLRQCPVCRIETHFIIPSSRMVTSPSRKAALIATYRKSLADIPCRHFDEGNGTCPFGTSCFYAHKFADGTSDDRRVRTAVDADGQYDVLRQVRLEHFFQSSA